MRDLRVASGILVVGIGLAGPALAQVTPAPGGSRLPPGTTTMAVRCIAGFTLKQSGRSYTCTSAPVRCDSRYRLSDGAALQGDRFVYGCSMPPS